MLTIFFFTGLVPLSAIIIVLINKSQDIGTLTSIIILISVYGFFLVLLFIPFSLYLNSKSDLWRKGFEGQDIETVATHLFGLLSKLGLKYEVKKEHKYGMVPFRSSVDIYVWIPEKRIRIILDKTLYGSLVKIGKLRDMNKDTFKYLIDEVDGEFFEKAEEKPFEAHLAQVIEKGEMLWKFRSKRYAYGIIAWLFVSLFTSCLVIGSFWSAFFYGDSITEFIFFTPLWIFLILLVYMFFMIAVFDNLVVFERGFYPPLAQERRPAGLFLAKRTFIPFDAISELAVLKESNYRFPVIRIRAQGTTWIFVKNWDAERIAALIQRGIDEKTLNKAKIDQWRS
ncbi:MAG: hypothetical protein JSW28_08050 [Thermoplasmata archaeon]|nr:MAG: hypothetical protein JSW28_08050 [Thermoplasmata archaeon]